MHLLKFLIITSAISFSANLYAAPANISSTHKKTETDSTNKFEITKIELVMEGKERKLKLTIVDKNPNGALYSYPLYKVEYKGKIIAESKLNSYGLTGTELIPTTLKKLPKNFECTVYLRGHGEMGMVPHTLQYKAK